MKEVLADWRSASIPAKLRSALAFLEKLTLHPEDVGPGDAAAMRAAGASDDEIEDAVRICALFSLIDRVADALGFEMPAAESFERGARLLLKYGYGR